MFKENDSLQYHAFMSAYSLPALSDSQNVTYLNTVESVSQSVLLFANALS